MISRFFRFISSIALPQIVVVGLDVQDTHLFCVAALRKGEEEVDIIASASYELPKDAIVEGELKNPDVLRDTIKKFLALLPKKKWKGNSEPVFVLSLPPTHLYTETFFLPNLSSSELDQAIRLKTETSLPWPAREVYVDWHAVDIGDPDKKAVFVAASSKQILDPYFRIFLTENWRLGASEYHLFSLIRFIQRDSISSFIFVLIDEDGIEFSIYAHGSILAHYLEDVSKVESRQSMLEDKIRQLTSYAESHYGAKIQQIFIFDTSSWGKAPDELQAITGIPTQPFTPSTHLDARLSIAHGSALRPYSSPVPLLNLLPFELGGSYEENLFIRTLRFWGTLTTIVLSTFLAAFLSVYLFLGGVNADLSRQNESLAIALAQKQEQSAPMIEEAKDFNALLQTILGAEGNRTIYASRFSIVSDELQKNNLTLMNVRFSNQNEFFVSFFAPRREAALAFKENLDSSKNFQAILIPVQDLQKERDLEVRATFTF